MGREVKNRKTGRCAEGRAHGAEIEMMRENKMEKVIKKLGEKRMKKLRGGGEAFFFDYPSLVPIKLCIPFINALESIWAFPCLCSFFII